MRRCCQILKKNGVWPDVPIERKAGCVPCMTECLIQHGDISDLIEDLHQRREVSVAEMYRDRVIDETTVSVRLITVPSEKSGAVRSRRARWCLEVVSSFDSTESYRRQSYLSIPRMKSLKNIAISETKKQPVDTDNICSIWAKTDHRQDQYFHAEHIDISFLHRTWHWHSSRVFVNADGIHPTGVKRLTVSWKWKIASLLRCH
jgi:hypothetical protein